MDLVENALSYLESETGKAEKRSALSFDEYLKLVAEKPERTLRNIFQLFYDMVKNYVSEGVDEYPDDPESIGFVKFDCSKLFVDKSDNPFFADRLFANRFIRQIESLRRGFLQNRIYIYEGPSGSGKSTFLNNLLRTFVNYTSTKDGQMFEVSWEIDEADFVRDARTPQKLIIPCPSHDCPILVIPKELRPGFLNRLLDGNTEVKASIFGEKEYQWIFTGEICTICKSIFDLSMERFGRIDRVFKLLKVGPYKFDRRLGEGVSVFNPGDEQIMESSGGQRVGKIFTNTYVQDKLNELFGASKVKYVYSSLARTNNGIYVLMDIKGQNEDRLLELHNVISEGVHKVGDVEEQINSLFIALMNPEDKELIENDKMESFHGRVQYNKITYVLEPSTEVEIYRSVLGESISKKFLPRILENFAKVIISSRMNTDCKPLKEWVQDVSKYKKYCDADGLLLRMSIYMGVIPTWLSEEDRKKFTAPVRRAMIAEGESEGDDGFSGRESIELFKEFFSRYSRQANLINMENVNDFFRYRIGKERRDENIPKNFLSSLVASYDYAVLNEMKEAIYFYNEAQISKDILNYLVAVNYDIGEKVPNSLTGEQVEVTPAFLNLVASMICGREMSNNDAAQFAKETQRKYTYAKAKGGNLTDSELYKDYFSAYVRNLKEKALAPFVKNANFAEAIKAYGTSAFMTFDTRLRDHVDYMIKNLIKKFDYTEQGAREICLYVIEKNLVDKFS